MANNSIFGRLWQVALLFLKLGAIGFGGPAAHIAMMRDEVVNRRRWLSEREFLDLLGATNLIPGPNSTEMAIHIGYLYAGWMGLIVAGVCFIWPAVLITGVLAWFYVTFGQLPQVGPLFYGVKPAVLAIILAAVWKLGKTAVKNRQLLLLAVAVSVSVLAGVNDIIALLLGGVLGMLWLRWDNRGGQRLNGIAIGCLPLAFSPMALSPSSILEPIGSKISLGFLSGPILSNLVAKVSVSVSNSPPLLWQLGLVFLKVGSVLFGSGYVLVAFLQGEVVNKYGWLTQQQLLDAIAIGQFTPGPVLSTATFIGYVIAGFPGAVVATVGIFLPSFLFVALLNPLIPRLRSSVWMSAFLDAVNVASVALMAVVTLKLALVTLLGLPGQMQIQWPAIFIAAAAVVATIRFKVNSAWVVLAGAVVGMLLSKSW